MKQLPCGVQTVIEELHRKKYRSKHGSKADAQSSEDKMTDHLNVWDKWFAGVDDTCEDITITSNEIANTDHSNSGSDVIMLD